MPGLFQNTASGRGLKVSGTTFLVLDPENSSPPGPEIWSSSESQGQDRTTNLVLELARNFAPGPEIWSRVRVRVRVRVRFRVRFRVRARVRARVRVRAGILVHLTIYGAGADQISGPVAGQEFLSRTRILVQLRFLVLG